MGGALSVCQDLLPTQSHPSRGRDQGPFYTSADSAVKEWESQAQTSKLAGPVYTVSSKARPQLCGQERWLRNKDFLLDCIFPSEGAMAANSKHCMAGTPTFSSLTPDWGL